MFMFQLNERASGVASSICRLPSRSTAIFTVRPSGVSWTSRVNCRALRTRSPSNSTTTSPAFNPAFSAALSFGDFVDLTRRRAFACELTVEVADRHAKLAASAIEHHQVPRVGACRTSTRS